jgi:tRNA G37 N-methylase Trm5
MLFLARSFIRRQFTSFRFEINNFRTNTMKLTFDARLKGMKVLEKELFNMKVKVPAIKVRKNDYNALKRSLRSLTLESLATARKFQDLNENDALHGTHKYILLDPDVFKFESLNDTIKNEVSQILKLDSGEEALKNVIEDVELNIGYDDLKFDEVMRAIIPDELQAESINVKGYSIIGHIAHFNLRDLVLDYKHIIGN